jgi:hypothetical protein
LHFFISAIHSNAHEELIAATGSGDRIARQWRSLLEWSQDFGDPDGGIDPEDLSVPEWFHDESDSDSAS